MNMNRIYIEGNNGGNYIDIEKIDDNRISLKVGDCCVNTIDVIITAEALSNFLTNIFLKENRPFLDIVFSYMAWDSETNEEFFKGCKEN